MQSFDVVCHADEVPFALDCFEPSQHKASEAHDRLDDAKDRFGCDLALGIHLLAGGSLQPILHLGNGIGIIR